MKQMKQGMVCILRNKESIIVAVSGFFFTSSGLMYTLEEKYNEDLTHKENRHLDIMEVTYGDEVVFKRSENKEELEK